MHIAQFKHENELRLLKKSYGIIKYIFKSIDWVKKKLYKRFDKIKNEVLYQDSAMY